MPTEFHRDMREIANYTSRKRQQDKNQGGREVGEEHLHEERGYDPDNNYGPTND